MLIIEDETLFGNELKRHFVRDKWEVVHVKTLAAGRRALVDDVLEPLVIISDMSLPDGNALDLLEEVRDRTTGEWILLTGYGSVADSVRAVRLGAFDFLEKPCPTERLDLVVAGARRGARAQRRIREITEHHQVKYAPSAFLGRSQPAADVRALLERLASVPLRAVVLGGETGTGKGLTARILHHSGRRAEGPMVELNCAALPHDLLESELFGHEAGAFTGAQKRRRGLVQQANGGTLFLDEIGEMDTELQSKLLRVIEEHVVRPLGSDHEVHVDVQVVAASHRNLAEGVANGTFRADLYHRLSVFSLDLPALRSRLEDLEDLVPQFLAEFSAEGGRSVHIVPENVWAALRNHDWPGNVRELRNVLERGVLFADSEVFPEKWLQLRAHPETKPTSNVPANVVCVPVDGSVSLDDFDRSVVTKALELAGGNVSQAARLLKTTRQTLRYRIQKHGLQSSDGDDD